ncbi:CLUMA_CG016913, isoform A [Clunio marinus]|uniref:CLUMA_CG016913, isoform A n=1 Tax=Clunio marinus TaxID=568069 RepID=A0A1J1IU54_9DIPT|nr:CLUMA_CG016913, isoform A [Clunio marinus]
MRFNISISIWANIVDEKTTNDNNKSREKINKIFKTIYCCESFAYFFYDCLGCSCAIKSTLNIPRACKA